MKRRINAASMLWFWAYLKGSMLHEGVAHIINNLWNGSFIYSQIWVMDHQIFHWQNWLPEFQPDWPGWSDWRAHFFSIIISFISQSVSVESHQQFHLSIQNFVCDTMNLCVYTCLWRQPFRRFYIVIENDVFFLFYFSFDSFLCCDHKICIFGL